jgi:hypothetical protein
MPRPFGTLVSAVILAALGVLLATFTLGPLRRGQWAIVDDHEIAGFVGPSGRLSFRDIPEKLGQTEVGQPGGYPRFRPSYYGLRLVESSLWGLRPSRWYRARIVLYSVSVMLVGWLLAARIGLVAAAGWLVWVLSDRYWFHVWGRLGPTESYAVMGAAVWLWGVHMLWPVSDAAGPRPRWRVVIGVILFLLGNAIVVGAKENLLVLAGANAGLALVETRAGRSGGVRWWACAAAIAMAMAVAIPLVIYLARAGVDQYGRSVGLAARLDVLGRGVRHLTAVHVAVIGALALWIGTRAGHAIGAFSASAAWWRLTSGVLLASAAALALYLSQFVFYNGTITAHTHYEFPASLAVPALLVTVAILLRRFLLNTGRPGAERAVYHLTGAVLVALALLGVDKLQEQRTMADGWAKATREFTAAITRAAAVVRTAPDVPVVVTSGRPLDLEHILAVGRFLHALGSSNRLFLVLDWDSHRSQWDALETYLAPDLEVASREGRLGYAPISGFDAEAPCFSIGLGTAPRPGCRSLGRLS